MIHEDLVTSLLSESKRSFVRFLRDIVESSDGVYLLPEDRAELMRLSPHINQLLFSNSVELLPFPWRLKIKNEISSRFLESLASYIENDKHLVASWDIFNVHDYTAPGQIFDSGIQLLFEMETRRSSLLPKRVLAKKDIILVVIKAALQGKEEPFYLTQFNLKTLRYQLIGGFKKDGEETDDEAAIRLLQKELPFIDIPSSGSELAPLIEDGVHTYTVSRKSGIYTEYTLKIFTCKFSNLKSLKLSSQDRWVTLEEFETGMTTDGHPIKSIQDDIAESERLALKEKLISMPPSISDILPADHLPVPESEKPEAVVANSNNLRAKDLLKGAENEHVEFKSSIRWDYFTSRVNKSLDRAIVKTIAAFLNSQGGILLIGVDDERNILGIEKDIQTLTRKNEDGYIQFVMSLIADRIGVEYMAFVRVSLDTIDGKRLCIVHVTRSPQPVFIREGEHRDFYARIGNMTRMLNPEETLKYIQINW